MSKRRTADAGGLLHRKPEPPEEQDSITGDPAGLDQSADGGSAAPKSPPPSPPPPPPIDVIAVDVTGHLLTDDVARRDVDEELGGSIVDDEYCHSPLGGAMPESDDSSGAEFVFP